MALVYGGKTLKNLSTDLQALALKEAITENRAAYNLPNAMIEQFQDDSKIGTETTVDRNASEYISSIAGAGYAFTNDANTKYLNRFEASDLDTDSSSGSHSITHTGTGISRSSTQAKFGTYSMAGTGANTAFIRLPSHSDFAFSTNVDCTIEGWFRVPNVSGNKGLWGTTGYDFVLCVKDATLGYYVSTASTPWNLLSNSAGSQTVVADTWHHFAVVREGSAFTSYLDGVVDKTATSANTDLSQQFNIGSDIGTGTGSQSWGLNGYMDEVRFSNTARYTSTFTPPIEATIVNATGTLISTANTANSAQTKVSGVILYKNEEGTATLGTDLKIYFTCNGGTNWTESTPTAAGTFSSGILMAKCPEVTCTSGTDIRYKAVWANQSDGSKETQLHGIGMNY